MRAHSRPLGAAVALAALAAGALGCQESGFDEGKETVRPLKVQHVLGETKVPGQAEQPLTLTLDTLDDTVSLGVRPARAAVPAARLPAYLREEAAGVPLMRPVGGSDLAAVEAVHADLILGSEAGQGALYDDLSRIAPTVMTEGGGGQWRLNLRLAGEALGRTNDAEALLTAYDRQAARAREAIGTDADTDARAMRVAVARLTADGMRFAPRDSFAGTILADTGVTQVTRDSPNARIDVILLSRGPGAKREANPDATAPTRARARIVNVDDVLWSGPGGALAAGAALADLTSALTR